MLSITIIQPDSPLLDRESKLYQSGIRAGWLEEGEGSFAEMISVAPCAMEPTCWRVLVIGDREPRRATLALTPAESRTWRALIKSIRVPHPQRLGQTYNPVSYYMAYRLATAQQANGRYGFAFAPLGPVDAENYRVARAWAREPQRVAA